MVEIKTGSGSILAKLESLNPTGSVKDRMAYYMIKKAEERGEIRPGSEIIEMTSGNTGISFAMLSSLMKYRFTAIMPSCMSVERAKMMRAFGAKIILTPAKEDMNGAVKKYNEMTKRHPGAWLPRQFENYDNIAAHRTGLGREILRQAKKVDAFVAGIGTGGTLIGVAQALKRVNPMVKIIGVEPAESAVLSGKKPGCHNIQGIGEGFIPKLVQDNIDIIDEVTVIKSRDAIGMTKKLLKAHGLWVGISSGANVLASILARKKYANVVTVLPDRGDRYLSTGIFD
jgi:cysteine synthase